MTSSMMTIPSSSAVSSCKIMDSCSAAKTGVMLVNSRRNLLLVVLEVESPGFGSQRDRILVQTQLGLQTAGFSFLRVDEGSSLESLL